MKITRRKFLQLSLGTGAVAVMGGLFGRSGLSLLKKAAAKIRYRLSREGRNVDCLADFGFSVDKQYVQIPGLKGEYHFCFVNDLHIIIPNEEVAEESLASVKERYELGFIDGQGTTAEVLWDRIVTAVGKMELDGVILAADMLDYYSEANFSALKTGIARIKQPVMYLRADHDYSDSYVKSFSWEAVEKAQQSIDAYLPIFIQDYEEFLLVGISHSTSPISDEGVRELERVLSLGKPVVLVNHVPYVSLTDPGLQQASREAWREMELLWGYEGTLYQTTDSVRKMLDLIYKKDSPVVSVFGGHLHFAYDGPLTDTVWQHVFDASHKGTLGYVVVTGE